jgi:predicted DsbA family dithiol-disulfide isomerase
MADSKANTIKIEVTSDSICPFCFIGKRKLDRALETFKASEDGKESGVDFDVEFKPFLLDPSLTEDK